jgi:hypothetical protein
LLFALLFLPGRFGGIDPHKVSGKSKKADKWRAKLPQTEAVQE